MPYHVSRGTRSARTVAAPGDVLCSCGMPLVWLSSLQSRAHEAIPPGTGERFPRAYCLCDQSFGASPFGPEAYPATVYSPHSSMAAES